MADRLATGKRIFVVLALVMLFALLDLAVLGAQQSLNIHEQNHMLCNNLPESNGILYHQLHIWYLRIVPCPHNPWAQRLPAILCCLGTIFLTYLLGKHWGGRRLGLLSAFVLSTNILFLALGFNHRFYAMNMAMSVGATLLWWLTLRHEDNSKFWWLYCLAMLGVMTSMMVSVAIAIPQAVFFLIFCRRKWRALGRYVVLLLLLLGTLGALCLHDPTSYGILCNGFDWRQESQKYVDLVLSDGFSYDKMLNNIDGVATATISKIYGHQKQAVNYGIALALLAGLLWSPIVWTKRLRAMPKKSLFSDSALIKAGVFPCLLLGILLAVGSLMCFSLLGRAVLTTNNLSWILPFASILIAQGLNGPGMWHRLTVPVVCLCLMYGSPLLTQGSYICGTGCGKIRDLVAMYQRPRDIIITDSSSTLPGLDDYTSPIDLALPPDNVRPEMTTLQKVDMCSRIAQATDPVPLFWEDYMLFLQMSPQLHFMRDRRVWVIYKPHLDPYTSTLVKVFCENYDPNFGKKASETHWNLPEGQVSLLHF